MKFPIYGKRKTFSKPPTRMASISPNKHMGIQLAAIGIN